MTPLDQLRGLHALIAPEGAWLPVSFGAVDADGHSCPACSAQAIRFGMLAGLVRLRGGSDERLHAVDLLRRTVDAKWLHTWEQEPGRTQVEILDAIDRAIALKVEGEWR